MIVNKISQTFVKLANHSNTLSQLPTDYLNVSLSTKNDIVKKKGLSKSMEGTGELGQAKQNTPFSGINDPTPSGGGGVY